MFKKMLEERDTGLQRQIRHRCFFRRGVNFDPSRSTTCRLHLLNCVAAT